MALSEKEIDVVLLDLQRLGGNLFESTPSLNLTDPNFDSILVSFNTRLR